MNNPAALSQKQTVTVQSHYARLARHYDNLWDRYSRVSLERLSDRLALTGDEVVLDLACGTGRLGAILRAQHPELRLTGMDLSADMLEVARERLPPDERTHWEQGSMESLPFADDSFDVITCASAFHLLTDQQRALEEMARVVRPGGVVCIVDWCRQVPQMQFIQWLARLAGRQYRNILTQPEIEEKMRLAGLEVATVDRFNATWFWVMMCVFAQRPQR